MQPVRRMATSFFARLSLRRLSSPAMPHSRGARHSSTSFAAEGVGWSSSESLVSTPGTPYSPARSANPRSPLTPDGFYGFGDEGETPRPAGTPLRAEAPLEGVERLVMGLPSQSSLVRRRAGARQPRPSSCPAGDGALQLGSVSSSNLVQRRKARSLRQRPQTADAADQEDCAFGFEHEFIFTAHRWRGVTTPLSPDSSASVRA